MVIEVRLDWQMGLGRQVWARLTKTGTIRSSIEDYCGAGAAEGLTLGLTNFGSEKTSSCIELTTEMEGEQDLD